MLYDKFYDVIVIGGGHAGTEAALAASEMGAQTLLLTHNIDTIGHMSCNPAIGGIGKGHLVKEIDALGGIMGKAIDQAGIQFRTLNASKGPAVQSTRAQADRNLYRNIIRKYIDNQNNLDVFQQSVDDIIIENNKAVAVATQMGLVFNAKSIVLTAGTFLNGKIHIGNINYKGGRAGDKSSVTLAEKLKSLPFNIARLKTGTPPRIDGKTVDYSVMDKQYGDDPLPLFSFEHQDLNQSEIDKLTAKQICCYITYTNPDTHKIIADNINTSAMYSGNIEGIGPRYCPSIEDKVMRFADRERHQIFVEPEGLGVTELYPNGLSTSLSFDVQYKYIRSITGFNNAHITRPGYAIEYDFFDPRGLCSSLETKYIENLFFAGQINGTTGYEEAAAQGIIAGINAALKSQNKALYTPMRSDSYIGVLIDDLITKGTIEPYRMFTSRAEYRLLLREDNADYRLTKTGYDLGLISTERFDKFTNKYNKINKELEFLKSTWVQANSSDADLLNKYCSNNISREYNLEDLLKRPEVNYNLLKLLDCYKNKAEYTCKSGELTKSEIEQVEIITKYSGYIKRQLMDINKQQKNELLKIPNNIIYKNISGLSSEIVEKLNKHKPENIGQASRISGVTPAAISLLIIYITSNKIHHNQQMAS